MFKIRNWLILAAVGLSGIIVIGSDINVTKLYNQAESEIVHDFNNGIDKLKNIHIG